MMKSIPNRGFNLIEIVLTLAVATLVFTTVFSFAVSFYVRIQEAELPMSFFSYSYGEPYCVLRKSSSGATASSPLSFSSYISTSTRVTSVHSLGYNRFIVTTDSASTSESDIFLFIISTSTANISLVVSIDTGPGIQDSKILGNYLYVANTSVNSHVKSFHIDLFATGTEVFKELSNIRIPSLSAGVSNPKKLSIYNKYLILGTEKSNTGPEIFIIPIELDGVVRSVYQTFELGGQLNQALSTYENLYIANAADPELRLVNKTWQEFFSYDAPLTLGNGKSILYLHPYMILGRTLGSSELSLLKRNGTTTEVLDTDRTMGTVDYIQNLFDYRFLTITANETKELQFWHVEGGQLLFDRSIDILGRVTAYTCDRNTIYVFVTSNNQTSLIWLNL